MFTTGRIVFVTLFLITFIAMLVWSYRKDRAVSRIHFKSVYKILIGLGLLLALQFLIVKMHHILG